MFANTGSIHFYGDLMLISNDDPLDPEVKSNEVDDAISIEQIGWISDSNQLILSRFGSDAFRFFWGAVTRAAYPTHDILNDASVVRLAGTSGDKIVGVMQHEIPGTKVAIVDSLGSYQANQMLSFDSTDAGYIEIPDRTVAGTATPNISGITQADRQSLTSAIRALLEDDTQISDQDETQEIRNRYVKRVNEILEAKALLYKQDKESIEFVVVVDHIRRDHSFQLTDLACQLDDLYPNWDFGFQYVSVHTAGQLPLDEYSHLINNG